MPEEFDRRTLRTVSREIPSTRAISCLLTFRASSSRIVVRCALLNILWLLPFDTPGQMRKLVARALDFAPRLLALRPVHMRPR